MTQSKSARAWWVTLGLPILWTLIGLAVLATFSGQLPDPVASHWGLSGAPDGSQSLRAAWWFTALFPLVMGGGLGALLLAIMPTHQQRMAAALSSGTTVFLVMVFVGTLWGQRGLNHWRDAPDVGGVIIAATLAALLAGALGYRMMPKPPPLPIATGPLPANAITMELRRGAQASWTGRVVSKVGLVVCLLGLLPMLPFAIADSGMRLFFAILAVVWIAAALALWAYRVSVGENGLVVRGMLGWPTFRVPLENAVVAEVGEVHPFRDFGGWGYRVNLSGETGIVVRKGEALKVRRSDDTWFVVTVDDAKQAAALFNALLARQRPSSSTEQVR